MSPNPPPEYTFQQVVADYFQLYGTTYLVYADNYTDWVNHNLVNQTPLPSKSTCTPYLVSLVCCKNWLLMVDPNFLHMTYKNSCPPGGYIIAKHRLTMLKVMAGLNWQLKLQRGSSMIMSVQEVILILIELHSLSFNIAIHLARVLAFHLPSYCMVARHVIVLLLRQNPTRSDLNGIWWLVTEKEHLLNAMSSIWKDTMNTPNHFQNCK